MECARFQLLIHLNREGELTEQEASELASHLSSCERCSREHTAVDGADRLLRRLTAVRISPPDPDQLTEKVLARIRQTSPSHRHARTPRLRTYLLDLAWLPPVRYATATIILLLTGTFLFQYFSVLNDIRRLEQRQARAAETRLVPVVSYAIDLQDVLPFVDDALLSRMGIGQPRGPLVVGQQALAALQHMGTILLVNLSPEAKTRLEKDRLGMLVTVLKNNARVTLTIANEGI